MRGQVQTRDEDVHVNQVPSNSPGSRVLCVDEIRRVYLIREANKTSVEGATLCHLNRE